MILVNEIEPINLLSKYKKISDLEPDYILRFHKGINPEDLLRKAITNKKRGRKSIAKSTQLAILNYLLTNFRIILIQKPTDLHDTINLFEVNGWQNYIHDHNGSTEFGKLLTEIYGYTKRFRSQVNRGIWLAQQLNIKSCPYCNAQYTIVVTGNKRRSIAKFQYDHFFSKDRYPYLSISLYNLITSCANCNITKSEKSLNLKEHYHPYFSDFSVYFKFHLKYNPDPKRLTINQVKTQNLEIELVAKYPKSKVFVDEHNKLYHINGVFNRHQDIAEDMLIKAIIYTRELQKTHLKIAGLFPDKSTYLKYLIGNFSNSKEILKRPLTKFIQDIAKQLNLY